MARIKRVVRTARQTPLKRRSQGTGGARTMRKLSRPQEDALARSRAPRQVRRFQPAGRNTLRHKRIARTGTGGGGRLRPTTPARTTARDATRPSRRSRASAVRDWFRRQAEAIKNALRR